MVFLDIKKAFDTIDHEILRNKLNYYDISDTELQFFRSYLHNRKQCCNINSYNSSVKTIKYGVPQGSILGPLLFIICMNDVPKCVDNAHITMHADDTSSSTTVETCDDIKEKVIPDFFSVIDWLKANKLSLNAVKTEFMLLGSAPSFLSFETLLAIRVGDSLIRRANCTKYLGIIVDETLSWDMHIDHISKKVKRNLGVMKHLKNCVPSQSLIMLYRTIVEPYFRYCSTTWGKCGKTLLDKLQTLQNRAARIVRGVKFEEADHNQLLRSLKWLSIRSLLITI